jgi:transposase
MPWVRSERSREEKYIQNIETIMALCVNIRILRCVAGCGLVERYRGIRFLRNMVYFYQKLHPRTQKSAHKVWPRL